MRARAAGLFLSVALVLTTAGAAAAAPEPQWGPAPGWYTATPDVPWTNPPGAGYYGGGWPGVGSSYFGLGGWMTGGPFYGPCGPYPLPQTAAFFGAGAGSNPAQCLAQFGGGPFFPPFGAPFFAGPWGASVGYFPGFGP